MEVVVMGNVTNRLKECLANSLDVAGQELGIAPPYQIAIGIVGLSGMCVMVPRSRLSGYTNNFSERIDIPNDFHIRRVLNNVSQDAQDGVLREFLKGLYELAAVHVD